MVVRFAGRTEFYYLCNDNNDCPEKLKNDIKDFIEFEGIEDNTRIMSWKKLLYSQVNGFSIEFSELIDYVRLNQYNWEMWPIGISSNFVIFTTGYVLKWYLTCLFSSYKIFNYDYKNLLINDNEVKYVLSNMIDTNLSQKDYLVLPKEMINMAEFYNLDKRLSNFKRNDQKDNKFFNFINGLRIDDLNQRQKQSAAVDLSEIIDEYKKTIVGKMESQWGFDDNIKLDDELKYISIILEKCSRACNYQEAVTEGILRAIYDEIERNILSKELHYDSITDKDVEEILKNHITFYSENMKYLIGNNIHDKILQENFYEAINNARKFDSDILSGFYILLNNEDGFKFNINLDINGRNLTAEEISIEANKLRKQTSYIDIVDQAIQSVFSDKYLDYIETVIFENASYQRVKLDSILHDYFSTRYSKQSEWSNLCDISVILNPKENQPLQHSINIVVLTNHEESLARFLSLLSVGYFQLYSELILIDFTGDPRPENVKHWLYTGIQEFKGGAQRLYEYNFVLYDNIALSNCVLQGIIEKRAFEDSNYTKVENVVSTKDAEARQIIDRATKLAEEHKLSFKASSCIRDKISD